MPHQNKDSLVGAIEAGGTKFVCAVGTGPGDGIITKASFPTGDYPAGLLAEVSEWFTQQQHRHGKLHAIGIASFGPVDLNRQSRHTVISLMGPCKIKQRK